MEYIMVSCRRLLWVPLLIAAGCAPSAMALDASGQAVAVVQSAAASGAAGSRVLNVRGPVYAGDRVQTNSAGEAQIKFVDDTRLVVGPNSSLLIDSYVFNANRTAAKVGINALKGAFRFVSGVSSKQAYSIRTPAASIGIRGTRLDIAVRPNGQTSVVLFDGEARVCGRTGRCIVMSGPCNLVVVPPRGRAQHISSRQEKMARLKAEFPYTVSQSRLRPDFRSKLYNCGAVAAQPSGWPNHPVSEGSTRAPTDPVPSNEPAPARPEPEPEVPEPPTDNPECPSCEF